MPRQRKNSRSGRKQQQVALTIERAEDATSALKRLRELQDKKKFDMFRGQRKPWPIVSTLARLSPAGLAIATRRLNRFASWAADIAGMGELLHEPDKLLAIAQHYGIATTFLDFTSNPDVAYFFATQSAGANESVCRVLCGSSTRIDMEFAAFRKRFGTPFPRIVRISVDNLWRLEAQDGFFVDLPLPADTPLESLVHLHAIDFCPDSQYPALIAPERVYPERKSALELQLDNYFYEEYVQDGLKRANESGIEIQYSRWEENAHAFKSCQLPSADISWTEEINQQWSTRTRERFVETVGTVTITVSVPKRQVVWRDARAQFETSLLNELQISSAIRKSAVIFKCAAEDPEDIEKVAAMGRPLQLFWDGVRQLPFTDKEISEGFGVLATLVWMAQSHEENYMQTLLGDLIEVECYSLNWVHFRAPISKRSLESALRSEIRADLDLASFPVLGEPLAIINHLHDVRRLFGFPQFKELMITEIIPGQIIKRFDTTGWYGDPDLFEVEPMWIVFNPLHVTYLRSATYYIEGEQRIRDRDRRISLHPDCSIEDLTVLAWEAKRRIATGSRPGTVTFAGFPNFDEKEVFEIPQVRAFCEFLIDLGFVSILEVTTSFSFIPESYDPYTLGAFEIWLLAKGLMKKAMEVDGMRRLFLKFSELLPEINQRCESLFAEGTAFTDERIAEATRVGLIGRTRD
jgi:hypothetical protein